MWKDTPLHFYGHGPRIHKREKVAENQQLRDTLLPDRNFATVRRRGAETQVESSSRATKQTSCHEEKN